MPVRILILSFLASLWLWPASAHAQAVEWERYMNNGVTAYHQGKYAEAEKQVTAALKIAKDHFRPVDERLYRTLNQMALIYEKTGRYTAAVQLFEKAIAMGEKSLGANHRKLVESLDNLAGVYERLGRYDDAERIYVRTLAIKEKILDPENPRLALDANKLASLTQRQGRYAEAEPLYKRAIAIYEKSLGREHPITAGSLNDLANLYQAQGKYAEAASLHQRVLALRETCFGSNHPLVVESLVGYATQLRKTGRSDEAAKLEARTETIRAKGGAKRRPTSKTHSLLLLNLNFQVSASQQGSPKEGVRVSCACFDRPHYPEVFASPSHACGGWDCPNGWEGAACRIDTEVGVNFWVFTAATFPEKGSSPVSKFAIKPFRGELGAGGKAIPPGPGMN